MALAVESFEPHAKYMQESGVWSRADPRYWIERRIEALTKKHADLVLPVSNKYRDYLIQMEGMDPERVVTVPCHVNLRRFTYKPEDCRRIREKWNWQDKIVGVYSGKFGGIYYGDAAFDLFAGFKKKLGDIFRLLILTPDRQTEIERRLIKRGFGPKEVRIIKVDFEDMPGYLSVADFAFSFHIPAPSKIALSPVKHGEYWACGLPIVLPPGLGDDSEIVVKENAGAILDIDLPGKLEITIKQIIDLTKEKGLRERMRSLAVKYRSPDLQLEAYKMLLRPWSEKS